MRRPAGLLALARVADAAGYRRYWVAEHHNMPAVAATNPPLLIAMLAGATERIRVGSGGVMLPNHAPLVVAEQFALLEAAYPGRIDLGIGRAPGSDPVTNWALRHGAAAWRPTREPVPRARRQRLIAMMEPAGVGARAQGGPTRCGPRRRRPAARVWLLGSSDFSARLAASKGLPYVFAHHFSGSAPREALALYRDAFRPSAISAAAPITFLTVERRASPRPQAEAERLARPQLFAMVNSADRR